MVSGERENYAEQYHSPKIRLLTATLQRQEGMLVTRSELSDAINAQLPQEKRFLPITYTDICVARNYFTASHKTIYSLPFYDRYGLFPQQQQDSLVTLALFPPTLGSQNPSLAHMTQFLLNTAVVRGIQFRSHLTPFEARTLAVLVQHFPSVASKFDLITMLRTTPCTDILESEFQYLRTLMSAIRKKITLYNQRYYARFHLEARQDGYRICA